MNTTLEVATMLSHPDMIEADGPVPATSIEINVLPQHTPRLVIDSDREIRFWRREYPANPAFNASLPFERYMPAIQLGISTYLSAPHADGDVLDAQLRSRCERMRDTHGIEWHEVAELTRAVVSRCRIGKVAQA